MKQITFYLLIFLYFLEFNGYSQTSDSIKSGTDVAINILLGNTYGNFKKTYDKDFLFGFNGGASLKPFKKFSNYNLGAQFEIFIDGKRKDELFGVELTTQSVFIRINLVNLLVPKKAMVVKPFLEFDYGINLNSTSSTYEIVDDASFFEEFFLHKEDVVQTKTVKDYLSINQNFEIGAGIIIKKAVVISLKYNYVPETNFVKKDGVSVENGQVVYKLSKSKIQLLILGIGFTFNSANSDKTNMISD